MSANPIGFFPFWEAFLIIFTVVFVYKVYSKYLSYSHTRKLASSKGTHYEKGIPIKQSLKEYPYEAMLGSQYAFTQRLSAQHWTEEANMEQIEKDEVCVYLKQQYLDARKKYEWLSSSWGGMLAEGGYGVAKELAPSVIPQIAKTINKGLKQVVESA